MNAKSMILVLATLAPGALGCQPLYEETPCNPGPFFDGPGLDGSQIASAGDRFLMTWRQHVGGHGGYHGVALDADGAEIAGSRFDFDPEQRVYGLASGPGHVLAYGGVEPEGRFVDLRMASGARVVRLDSTEFGYGIFDGDAYLIPTSAGSAFRLELDGTMGAPFALPPDRAAFAVTDAVTWVFFESEDGVFTAARIARGGGLIDATPQLVSDGVYFWLTAARPSEAVMVTQDRDGARALIVLAPDGVISAPIALDLEVPSHYRPQMLIPERDGYVLVLEDFTLTVGVRVAVDGAAGVPFTIFDHWNRDHTSVARMGDRTMLAYTVGTFEAQPPRIEVMPVDSGALPGVPRLVETVEGSTYTVDCGCSAGGGTPGLLVMLALLALLRVRRYVAAAR